MNARLGKGLSAVLAEVGDTALVCSVPSVSRNTASSVRPPSCCRTAAQGRNLDDGRRHPGLTVTDEPVQLAATGYGPRTTLAARLVEELTLHFAPVVLGSGTPLFTGGAPRTLVQRSVTSTSTATHLTYDVL